MTTNSTSEREQRLRQIRERQRVAVFAYKGDKPPQAVSDIDFLLSLLDSEAASDEPNLTEHDKTRFLERGFTVVENAGRNLRLIKRDDARQAISIKWDDLPALRELITLALDDGPMVIGLDMSGQAAKNAATSMRDLCVEKVKEYLTDCREEERGIIQAIASQLQSLTLEQEQK